METTFSTSTGKFGQYHWLELTGGSLWDVLEVAPQVVVGKSVSVTSHDSGPLTPAPAGWRQVGNLAVSPTVAAADQIPSDLFDEWYIFDTPTGFVGYEVFINYSGFSLYRSEPEDAVLQERFWRQLERISPMSYLAEGDNLIWATRHDSLFEQVSQAMRAQT